MRRPDSVMVVLQRQFAQRVQAFFAQLLPVEAVRLKGLIAHEDIPVAAQHQVAARHGPIEGIVAGGPFAHNIAQTIDLVRAVAVQVPLQRVRGRAVAVQVGDHGDSHRYGFSFQSRIVTLPSVPSILRIILFGLTI